MQEDQWLGLGKGVWGVIFNQLKTTSSLSSEQVNSVVAFSRTCRFFNDVYNNSDNLEFIINTLLVKIGRLNPQTMSDWQKKLKTVSMELQFFCSIPEIPLDEKKATLAAVKKAVADKNTAANFPAKLGPTTAGNPEFHQAVTEIVESEKTILLGDNNRLPYEYLKLMIDLFQNYLMLPEKTGKNAQKNKLLTQQGSHLANRVNNESFYAIFEAVKTRGPVIAMFFIIVLNIYFQAYTRPFINPKTFFYTTVGLTGAHYVKRMVDRRLPDDYIKNTVSQMLNGCCDRVKRLTGNIENNPVDKLKKN